MDLLAAGQRGQLGMFSSSQGLETRTRKRIDKEGIKTLQAPSMDVCDACMSCVYVMYADVQMDVRYTVRR